MRPSTIVPLGKNNKKKYKKICKYVCINNSVNFGKRYRNMHYYWKNNNWDLFNGVFSQLFANCYARPIVYTDRPHIINICVCFFFVFFSLIKFWINLAANKLVINIWFVKIMSITIDSFSCSLSVATVSEGYKPESLHAKGQNKNSCIKKSVTFCCCLLFLHHMTCVCVCVYVCG